MTRGSLEFDEHGHAGPEHLDAEYVARYDRKAATDPSDDVAALRSANYSHLIARADEQRSTVEVQRLRWAAAALTTR